MTIQLLQSRNVRVLVSLSPRSLSIANHLTGDKIFIRISQSNAARYTLQLRRYVNNETSTSGLILYVVQMIRVL